ncbi:hypothetical protein [Xanthomonas vesicatoria]|uniref:Uncharacterized protein n=1 Tax=Xanthomonas vesicatoria TaxID=56460 RepID=A0ABS8L3Y7_9XANT|nr:hypothetical protein [Xanthomonas vesicatoria]MCC8620444.1 hypothetical protein [Xanthomonas vesicatoria]MDG4491541.1 hypothetical protein [Xanthomonas vesicatoria]
MSFTDMPTNERTAGRIGATAQSRADIAAREFRLGLLSDLKRPLSYSAPNGKQHGLSVYVVGYVSLDVVVLSAPEALLEASNRTAAWCAVFESLQLTDYSSVVLVEHACRADGIVGDRLVGPVTVKIRQDDDRAAFAETTVRKVV